MLHISTVIDDNLVDTNSVHVCKNLPSKFREHCIHSLRQQRQEPRLSDSTHLRI